MKTDAKKIVMGVINSLGLSTYEAIGLLEVIKDEIQSIIEPNKVVNTSIYNPPTYTAVSSNNQPSTFVKPNKDETWEDFFERIGTPMNKMPITKNLNQATLFEKKKKKKEPKPKRVLTPEQKQILVDRIAKARESRRLKKLEKKHITIPAKGETNLKDWADILIMGNKIKQRLYNGLIKLHNRGFFLEDTHQQAFLEVENLGMDSWREFLKLRFEHFSKK